MTRIAVVGAGGVGSYFAARAALAGAEVTLCLRTARPDLVLRSGGQELRPVLRSCTDPADVGPVDWVLLGVKAHQNAGAAPWLKALDGATIVVMQNGVRLAQRLDGLWTGPVLPSVVYCGVEMVEPGVIEHRSYGFLEVQEGPLADGLAAAFGPDQHEVHPVPDIAYAGWSKLVSNAAVNSITALTCRRVDVLHDPGVPELASAVMSECVEVARAEGVDLPAGTADAVLTRVMGLPQDQGSSMLYDRLAGRPLEHEALIGAVVDIGAEHGVATPASALLLTLLRSVSGRAIGP
jgi:2-dehydropantoate 2-reductase